MAHGAIRVATARELGRTAGPAIASAAGWTLLAQRWRCRWGELDLLLHKPQRLLLVEVKGRTRCGPDGWGVGALHAGKRRRLESSLQLWLQQHPEYQDCRWE